MHGRSDACSCGDDSLGVRSNIVLLGGLGRRIYATIPTILVSNVDRLFSSLIFAAVQVGSVPVTVLH